VKIYKLLPFILWKIWQKLLYVDQIVHVLYFNFFSNRIFVDK